MWPVGVGVTRDTGGIGVYPTESCQEVALPGVHYLVCLIGTVRFWWKQLEVDDVCPEECF